MDSARSLGRQTLWIALGTAALLAQTACDTGNTVPDPPPTLNCPRLSMPDDGGQACTPLKTSGAKDAEMTFDSQQTPGGLIRLNGVVSAPQFDTPAPLKLPAVLLISEEGAAGDGALAGDTTGPFRGPVPVMADLAGALSERGFVVMRYDSRTCRACNYPGTVAEAATWQDLLGDAIAAGELLQARPEVDPDDLIIIGHGQGATLALETQAQLGASALVLLGAPFNPIDKVLARPRPLESAEQHRQKSQESRRGCAGRHRIQPHRRQGRPVPGRLSGPRPPAPRLLHGLDRRHIADRQRPVRLQRPDPRRFRRARSGHRPRGERGLRTSPRKRQRTGRHPARPLPRAPQARRRRHRQRRSARRRQRLPDQPPASDPAHRHRADGRRAPPGLLHRSRSRRAPRRQHRSSARRSPRHPSAPPGLDIRPQSQICNDPQACTLVRGLPGQPVETLCCATCQTRAAALNQDNAVLFFEWKRHIDCKQVACAPLGDCIDAPQAIGATCNVGVCALVY